MRDLQLPTTFLATVGVLASHAAGQSTSETVIELRADLIEAVEGVPVTVQQGSNLWATVTDVDGATPAMPVDPLQHFEIVLDEAPSASGGSSVGQRFVYDNRVFSSTDLDTLRLIVSVPECRPLIRHTQNGLETFFDGVYVDWMGHMEEGQWFSSEPLIGFLSDSRSVDAYLSVTVV